jgi:hypothetical protein
MIDDSVQSGDDAPSIAAAVVVHDGRVLLVRRSVPEAGLVWQFRPGRSRPASRMSKRRSAKRGKRLVCSSARSCDSVSGCTRRPGGASAMSPARSAVATPVSRPQPRSPTSPGATETNWRSWCRPGCTTPSPHTSTVRSVAQLGLHPADPAIPAETQSNNTTTSVVARDHGQVRNVCRANSPCRALTWPFSKAVRPLGGTR